MISSPLNQPDASTPVAAYRATTRVLEDVKLSTGAKMGPLV
jgi:hypothetical protein